MKYGLLVVLVVLAVTAACTTTRAPGVCCIGSEDCARLGLTEDRPCDPGQACVDFYCTVASCSTQGCTAAAEPVCDDGRCRSCRLDAECPSGACADDGSCVAEAGIVYLSPSGQDVAPCSRDTPCSGLQLGIRQTNETRKHVVMTPGSYISDSTTITIGISTTFATAIYIHGGGAKLTNSNFEPLLGISIPTTIRDLDIESGVRAISSSAELSLERVQINAGDGIQALFLKAQDVSLRSMRNAIEISGTLILDRAVIIGGTTGITTNTISNIRISNLLVYGTSKAALDLQSASGIIEFSTIVDTGMNDPTASGILCSQFSGPMIRASIIWTPGNLSPPINGGGCTLSSVLAGPIGVIGAMNLDPSFVNPQSRDYHLSPNSPARDMVNTGPALDFEREPRPQGARFDIGADESH